MDLDLKIKNISPKGTNMAQMDVSCHCWGTKGPKCHRLHFCDIEIDPVNEQEYHRDPNN
jgi:hypothetical protein